VNVKFNNTLSLTTGLLICLTLSCRTRVIEPVIPAGERVVLIEEFTGKGCTNCPKGSRELENLLSIYQQQLVVVSIHANFFANPQFFPLGQYDFRTDEGELLFDYLGPNLGYPAGVIDRRKFNNEFQQGTNVWAGYIAQESALEPRVEFTISRSYQENTRHLYLLIEGRAKFDIPEELRISVMITESGIIDAQVDSEAGGVVEDYVHNHVLRDMLTPFDGHELAPALIAGEEFEVEFAYEMSSAWNAAQCNIIAFISLNTNSGDITVLQAGETHVME